MQKKLILLKEFLKMEHFKVKEILIRKLSEKYQRKNKKNKTRLLRNYVKKSYKIVLLGSYSN